MVGSSAAALPNADKLPVGLGDDHQTLGHGCADVPLVPPPADLLIRGLRADQRRVVRSNVRLAEPADGYHVVAASRRLSPIQLTGRMRSLSSTQVYTRVSLDHLMKVYDAAHPHARSAKQKG